MQPTCVTASPAGRLGRPAAGALPARVSRVARIARPPTTTTAAAALQLRRAGRPLAPRRGAPALRAASSSATSQSPPPPKVDRRVPITVLTGFLGSGKTTTLNNLLTKDHGRRVAIIENEFGEIDIDSKLVSVAENTEDTIMMLNNGCLCCTVRGDLIDMIFDLLENRRKDFDHIMIETTGLANPAPIIRTFTDQDMSPIVRLDGVVTVVDAKHVTRHLDEGDHSDAPNEALEQLAYADRIILNKTDLVPEAELAGLEARIRAINQMATITRAQRGEVPVDYILGIGGYDLERVQSTVETAAGGHDHDHDHDGRDHTECDHDHGHCEHDHDHAHAHDDGHDHSNCDHDHGHCDHDHDHAGHSHGLHNDAVTSVSLRCQGDLDLMQVNTWLGALLQLNGENLYRMKGILSIAGYDQRFVFQGVHQLFEGNPDKAWKEGEERESVIVFIGRDLDRASLEEGFLGCRATSASEAAA